MKTELKHFTDQGGWRTVSDRGLSQSAQFVLAFGGSSLIKQQSTFDQIRQMYPHARIVSCSTAGEIVSTTVADESVALVAVEFAKTSIRATEKLISGPEESENVGRQLASVLEHQGLRHAMVFSDGQKVNGTALVKGLISGLPADVAVTGGLVGDGPNFKETYVGLDKVAESGKVVLIGFYSDHLQIGYGSLGGWDPFGPERIITRSRDNVLYELDGQPALELYKQYLGEEARGLPSTGLLFPLSLRVKDEESGGEVEVVRTLLGVNEADQSMIFAGDMPEGIPAKLMKANFERLIDGAYNAAGMSTQHLGENKPQLAVLISCIGRKLVLKERVEEEVEAVQEKVGDQAAMIGFYSYGEICPTAATEKQCKLHNQTMTITTFREEE